MQSSPDRWIWDWIDKRCEILKIFFGLQCESIWNESEVQVSENSFGYRNLDFFTENWIPDWDLIKETKFEVWLYMVYDFLAQDTIPISECFDHDLMP